MIIWTPNKPKVNRRNCTCSCFDTNFRGKTIITLVNVYVDLVRIAGTS